MTGERKSTRKPKEPEPKSWLSCLNNRYGMPLNLHALRQRVIIKREVLVIGILAWPTGESCLVDEPGNWGSASLLCANPLPQWSVARVLPHLGSETNALVHDGQQSRLLAATVISSREVPPMGRREKTYQRHQFREECRIQSRITGLNAPSTVGSQQQVQPPPAIMVFPILGGPSEHHSIRLDVGHPQQLVITPSGEICQPTLSSNQLW